MRTVQEGGRNRRRKEEGAGETAREALPRVPGNGLAQEVREKHSRPRPQAERVCASSCRRNSSENVRPRKWGGVRGPRGLRTHSMGFPLISDMMELSPPRYS